MPNSLPRWRRPATDDESRLAAQAADEVARVYARYEVLKGPGRIDFGDLAMLPTMLLETDETSRDHFAATYAHVLVDEYQDVNRASVRLLKQLRPQGMNLWAVGDIRQSIYRFRGASSHNMDLFETEDFPDAMSARLKVNYRSMREIIDTFTRFAKPWTQAIRPTPTSAPTAGRRFPARNFARPTSPARPRP